MQGNVVFSVDDCTVKIWEMNGDSKGNQVTTDLIFAQNVRFEEVYQKKFSEQCGSNRRRSTIVAIQRTLSISRFHTDFNNDMNIAHDPTKSYWFELNFKDQFNSQEETYVLKYCEPNKRGLASGIINNIQKQWNVGEYTII